LDWGVGEFGGMWEWVKGYWLMNKEVKSLRWGKIISFVTQGIGYLSTSVVVY
jgi:hypothetical protein